MKKRHDIATLWPAGSGIATARAWLGPRWTPQLGIAARSETRDRINAVALKDRMVAEGRGLRGGTIFGISDVADQMIAREHK